MKKNFAKMAPIGGIKYQIVIEIYLNHKIHLPIKMGQNLCFNGSFNQTESNHSHYWKNYG